MVFVPSAAWDNMKIKATQLKYMFFFRVVPGIVRPEKTYTELFKSLCATINVTTIRCRRIKRWVVDNKMKLMPQFL